MNENKKLEPDFEVNNCRKIHKNIVLTSEDNNKLKIIVKYFNMNESEFLRRAIEINYSKIIPYLHY